jgi:hypothetical protein
MRKTIILLALVLVLVACGDNPPPTQIVIVISPTPEMTASETPPDNTAIPTAAPTAQPTVQPTTAPTVSSTSTPEPERTPLPTATDRPEIFPTDVIAKVQIAEQVFEHGRMFWIRHNQQIWVMEASAEDPNGGDWFCYNDTFVEGEQEVDPTLIPPDSMYQPRRGFGKLWRNHPEIRDILGWAVTPEFELTSNYRYIAGGEVQDGQYLPGPGEHRLTTLYNESISFYEGGKRGDCQGGTWHMTPP